MFISFVFQIRKIWGVDLSHKYIIFKILSTAYSIIWRLGIILTILMSYIVIRKYGPIISAYNVWAQQTIEKSKEEDFKPKDAGTIIYDVSGNVIVKYSDGSKSDYIEYEDIPENIKNAFISVEDRTFYTNRGYDIKGIVRVFVKYIRSKGNEAHGASTITQQVVRMTYLTQEKSIKRKIKELFLSYYMTKKYSKDKILEFYINKCCFANNIYGIEAASRQYFGKNVSDLTLGESAYLCAIPNRPEYYNPWKNPANVIERRDKILRDMNKEGYVNDNEMNSAISEGTVSHIIPEQVESNPSMTVKERFARLYMKSYATDEAVKWQMEKDGFNFTNEFTEDNEYTIYQSAYNDAYSKAYKELAENSSRIYTSLNLDKTLILQNALDDTLSKLKEKKEDNVYDVQGSIAVIDNETGLVVGVVGGRSQKGVSSQLNRAYQSYRQPGSSIKPLIVYTPGLMRGYEPESILTNVSVKVANESGEMTDGEKITLRNAVEQSKNGCAYYLFNDITPEIGLSFIEKMKFARIMPSDSSLSAALGGLKYGTNTVEMAGAYHAIYDQGTFTVPTCLTSITDDKGNELYQKKETEDIYYKRDSAQMIDIMKGVVTSGTAHRMEWDQNYIEAAGKTGTTNDYKDGWFCGMTLYYTMTVWIGADTPHSIKGLQGATYPMKAWKYAMSALIEGKPSAQFDLSHETDPDIIYRTDKEKKEIELKKDIATAKKMSKKLNKEINDYLLSYITDKYTSQDEELLSSIKNTLSWIDICVTTKDAMMYIEQAKQEINDIRLSSKKEEAETIIKKAEKKALAIDDKNSDNEEDLQTPIPEDEANNENNDKTDGDEIIKEQERQNSNEKSFDENIADFINTESSIDMTEDVQE